MSEQEKPSRAIVEALYPDGTPCDLATSEEAAPMLASLNAAAMVDQVVVRLGGQLRWARVRPVAPTPETSPCPK